MLDADQGFNPVNFISFRVAKRGLVRDLYLLTAAKLLVLGIIYVALFAPFGNRPDNTASHLLGAPAVATSAHQTASGGP